MSNNQTTTTTATTASSANTADSSSNNSNFQNDDEIIYSGFLTKQGGNVHNWKIRWFVLKKGTLTYYLTNINWEFSKPRGIIYLTKRTEVKETDYRNRKFCFTVNPNYHIESQQSQSNPPTPGAPRLPTTNRIYLISAQTIFDQGKWIEKIRSALNDGSKISKKKANQIEKVKEMVQFKRKDSLPTTPTLLNRTKASETVNENIKVSLSKRKFYFYHDNLTVPLLSYVDSPEPTPIQYQNYHHRRDNNNSSNNSSSNNSSKSTSPTGSPTISPSTSPTRSSPFQFVKSKPPSVSSSSSSSSTNTPSLSTSPSSSRPASPIKNLLDEPSPFYNKPVTYIDINNNNNNNSTSSTPISNISPSSSPTNPNHLGFHRHQPKIIVHHLVRDSFQISNIGTCSFNFEILSPFDPNYAITFLPTSGIIAKGESLSVVVELIVYNHIEVDIYSTLHIRGGGEFTLYSRVETDPYLPLFLQSCSGVALSQESHKKMTNFIRSNPKMLKPLQELAHTMITEGRHIDPKSMSLPSISPRHGSGPLSRVRLSKYMLTFTRNKKNSGGDLVQSTAKIYQLLSDKFLISNSGQMDASFQFYIPNSSVAKSKYSLSLVPKNGTVACGEWFYIKCTMTVFEETEISEVIQLVINQKEIHHILISIKCENIHSGNKEIDLSKEVVLKERLGVGATGDIYKGLISIQNLKYHLSQVSFDSGGWVARRLPSSDSLTKDSVAESDMVVVAVKILHPLTEPSNEMIQDFYNEVRVLSMLNHPNVVKYVGGCTKIGQWSIVMEYVPGGNLMEVLANPVLIIPFKLVLKMAIDIAKGIHYLHSLGILHLDLKSPNLLVQSLSLGSKVNIKVADFNTCINRSRLTHFFTPSNIEDDGKKGTTLWMAPEVIRGALYSEKCDVFSFGIILWELVTRTLPYSNISFNCQIEEKVLEGMRPPRPDNVDIQYCQLMEQCWDQDPEQRPLFDSIIHSLGKILTAYEIQEQKAKASVRGLRRNHSGSSIMSFMQTIESPLTPPIITPPTIDASILDISNNNNNNNTDKDKDTKMNNKGTKSTLFRNNNIFSKQKSKRFSIEGSSIISRNDDAPSSIISTATNGSNLPFKFSPPNSFIKSSNTASTTKDNEEKKTSYLRYRPSLMGTTMLLSKSILNDLNNGNRNVDSNSSNNNDKPQKYQNSFFIPAHKKK
ncbi:hypothetical protein CYY_005299 [Polysphondylium violaceum]|uniref:Pleckstrin domain-containing protein n=1 Tax=Polysphondylium violaceum TaxID=133409 RepID=A0A8J4PU03_9MYCE|nr:hypothetical protein CYY_005299 [Polysphondylium violaceum]